MTDSTAVQTIEQKPAIGMSANKPGVLVPTDIESAFRLATAFSKSGMLPTTFSKMDESQRPMALLVAMQLGADCGMSPMQSIQNIAVINGKPAMYGPAQLAVVRASGKLKSIKEWADGDGDGKIFYCETERTDGGGGKSAFSVADAKRAGLWGKAGPWTQYPQRMMMYRARSFNLQDNFGDVLLGLNESAEVLQDHVGFENAKDLNETPVKTTKPAAKTKPKEVDVTDVETKTDAPELVKPESVKVHPAFETLVESESESNAQESASNESAVQIDTNDIGDIF